METRRYILSTVAAAASLWIATCAAESTVSSMTPPTADKAAILKTMSKYEAALNASSTADVIPLYSEDGVFMPPYKQAAIGTAALRRAYDAVFEAINLKVTFNVAEVVEMAPEWAFVRTTSAGTVTVHANGVKSAEANQELFILKKGADGVWKIARYSFSSTNPQQ